MTLLPPESILAISHIRSDEEISNRLEQVSENHEGLVLRRIVFTPSVCASLRNALQKNGRTSWTKVELRNVDGDVTTAITICMSVDLIREFQLVINNIVIQPSGWQALKNGLQVSQQLLCLRITTNSTGPGMSALSEGLTSSSCILQTLDLSWTSLEEDSLRELADGLRGNASIKNLELMGCSLQDDLVRQLVEALVQHATLEVLGLNGNKSAYLTSVALAALLSNPNSKLNKLDVSFQSSFGNDGTGVGLDVSLLALSLRTNTCLRILDLSDDHLTDDDAETLCRILCDQKELPTNSTLRELLLARNKITDRGMQHILESLPTLKGLKRLSLWGNPLADIGAKALSEGLIANVGLEDVDLFRTHRLLHAPQAPLGLWPLVLERLQQINLGSNGAMSSLDLLYYMLRGPALLHSR
jgi:Ran GTPase-activating protein (RanGAP) involved in mRNA processing and transport